MDPSKNPSVPHDTGPGRRILRDDRNVDDDDSSYDDDTSFLSEMIDDVTLASNNESNDRFNMALLNEQDEPMTDTRQYDERDYQSHRRESFPHTHHPLKPIHSRSMRKKLSISRPSDVVEEIASGSDSPNTVVPSALQTSQSAIQMGTFFEGTDEMDEPFESCPLLEYGFDLPSFGLTGNEQQPQPGSSSDFNIQDTTTKKVQFEVGGEPISGSDLHNQERRKHKTHRSHKYENPQWRLRQGSQVQDNSTPLMLLGMKDRDPNLPDLDQDDLTSHRYEDNKGFRRHRFFPKGQDDSTVLTGKSVRFDHKPHEIFVELSVLSTIDDKHMWREMARWIKYEEDVEELADRWGKPHVASLSFHSLINLRKLIEMGVCLLDLEERDLPGVAYRVVEQMITDDLIRAEDKGSVMRSILLKHKHVNENEGGWRFNLRRNTQSGSLTSLHAVLEDRRSKGSISEGMGLTRRNSATSRLIHESLGNGHSGHHPLQEEQSLPLSPNGQHVAVDLNKLMSNMSEEDLKWITNKESILRRIPVGSEASIVMVGKDDSLEQPTMAFVRLAESVYMPNITEVPIPVRFVYILLGPSSLDMDYKEIGRSISTLMSNRHFHEIAYKAMNRKHLLKGIHEFLDESIVLPPGDWDVDMFPFDDLKETSQALRRRTEKRRSIAQKGVLEPADAADGPPSDDDFDPLKRTRRPFGGMINEIRNRYPLYWTDIKDALNFQTIAAIIFIYFAAVSGAIAFGGILSTKTEQNIGISETLISSAGAGVFFSLFAGQPLIIVGPTAPLLLFDESLYKFATDQNINFLGLRFWIGIWISVIGLLVCACEGSVVARYISRFTQEIFAALISLLFIAEAVFNIVKIYESHPVMKTYGSCNASDLNMTFTQGGKEPKVPTPNTALLSTVLCAGTFAIAYACRAIKTGNFFTETIRKFLGNFGVPLAIGIMVGMDRMLHEKAETDKLNVPPGLSNTLDSRTSWIVPMNEVPIEVVFMAILPALLLFILVFMETSICSLIIGKKDQKLKKGGGFHLDILLISIINAGSSAIGGCWLCAATVRAVTHTSALTVYSTNNPPGEKPTILGAKEQRVSAFTVSLLVGLSVLMSPVLKLIPTSVLFGVFLYMGISSMSGIQFFERCGLLLKQVQNHPQIPYVRRVRTSKMHLFTFIQIISLAILWGIKYTPAALILPFILILLVPFRLFVLTRMFKPAELAALDAKGSAQPSKGSPEELDKLALEALVAKKNDIGGRILNGNNHHVNFRSV